MFQMDKKYFDRLAERIDRGLEFSDGDGFFLFCSVQGKSIALNLSEVQGFRFLQDTATDEQIATVDDGTIRIYLRGRTKPMEEFTAFEDEVFDLYTNLEHGPQVVPFPRFRDDDGEVLQLNAREIIWVSAQTSLLEDGRRKVALQDGLPLEE